MIDLPVFVFDTNVLISRLLFPESKTAQALRKATQIGVIAASHATLNELIRVIERPKFDRYISVKEREDFINDYLELVEIVPVTTSLAVCRDFRDNQYLELAVDGQATALITGDDDLLVLHPFRGVRILRPADFLAQVSA